MKYTTHPSATQHLKQSQCTASTTSYSRYMLDTTKSDYNFVQTFIPMIPLANTVYQTLYYMLR